MITDLLPLLSFVTVIVITRNLFEAYVLHREQRAKPDRFVIPGRPSRTVRRPHAGN